MDTLDIIQLAVSVAAVLVAAVALWFSNRNWHQSNRPIVTAMVRTRESRNAAIAYELVIANGGNRPATSIRLECDERCLVKALSGAASDPLVEDVRACFEPEATVPVLLHGESVANAFGMTCRGEEGSTWRYGSRVPVRVQYRDVVGRTYSERVDLAIQDSRAFAGGSWSDSL